MSAAVLIAPFLDEFTWPYCSRNKTTFQEICDVAKHWKSASITGQAATISPPFVPVSGTYVLSFSVGSNGSADLLIRLARDPIIEADADPLSLEIEIPGQSLRFGFFAEQGQWFGVGLADLNVTPPNGSVSVSVLTPDGKTLNSVNAKAPAAGLTLSQLPTTGTYQILIQPGNNAASFDLLLTEDESGALAANGAALTFNPTRIGQAAAYTFDGTAGQNVNLQMSGNLFVGTTTLRVHRPDGTQLTSTTLAYSSGAGTSKILTLNNLATTGTYTVRVIPPSGKLGSVSVAMQ